jgi:hypothetical protein
MGIRIARPLYAEEDLGLELDNTVYALDASTIDLCLSVFPWALFRATKSAVKLHTMLVLRGNIPTFIHISDGKLHDVNVLDILLPEAGAFYIMDRGYVDFERLFTLHMASAFFVIRAKSNTRYQRRYSGPVDKLTGVKCDQTIVLTGVNTATGLSAAITSHQVSRREHRQDIQLSDQQLCHPGTNSGRPVSLPLAGRTVLQMDQTAPAHQIFFRHVRECGEDSDMDCHLRLCAGRHHQEATQSQHRSLHNFTDFEPCTFRKRSFGTNACKR